MSTVSQQNARESIGIVNRSDGGVAYWCARLFAFLGLVIVATIALTGLLIYRAAALSTPEPPDLTRYAKVAATVSHLVAADGTPLGGFADKWREVVPFEEIPPMLVNAVIAAEDHRFFSHRGLDVRGIARAALRNLVSGDFSQGGSTLTQQVAKQFLGNEKSLNRKIKEAIMARRLEARYSKRAILAVYLNHIFLGAGSFGVKAAARRYFGKRLAELSVAEMALLAGLAQAPSRYSPLRSIKAATERRNEVLARMLRYGFINEEQANSFRNQVVEIHPKRESFGTVMPYAAENARRHVIKNYGKNLLVSGGLRIETTAEPVTEAFAYENVDFGTRKQDKRQGWRGPVTHLDEDSRVVFRERAATLYSDKTLAPGKRYLALVEELAQHQATVRVGSERFILPLRNAKWASRWSKNNTVNDLTINSLSRAIAVGDVIWVSAEAPLAESFFDWSSFGKATPKWKPALKGTRLSRAREEAAGRVVLEQTPHPQAAILTVDHRSGYVVAMVGGTDATRSTFNRALQACRQPGSTFKPIYYSKALDMGYGYDTVLGDIAKQEAVIDPVTGEEWIPRNLGDRESIQTSLEFALVFSKNVPSVGIFRRIGADNVVQWARRLGFTTTIIADKALALGASCTKLDELTRAFAIFAQSGRWVEFTHIRRIITRDGNYLEDNTVAYDPMLSPAERLDRAAALADHKSKQAIPERTAFLISKLLRQAIIRGFASILRATDVNAAGKTGTSSATMDTSFVAYTSRWITTIWMGDDLRERPLGRDDAAYVTVVPVWARYMRSATEGHPNKEIPWEVPDGVDPLDRGDHSLGSRKRVPLVYKSHSESTE